MGQGCVPTCVYDAYFMLLTIFYSLGNDAHGIYTNECTLPNVGDLHSCMNIVSYNLQSLTKGVHLSCMRPWHLHYICSSFSIHLRTGVLCIVPCSFLPLLPVLCLLCFFFWSQNLVDPTLLVEHHPGRDEAVDRSKQEMWVQQIAVFGFLLPQWAIQAKVTTMGFPNFQPRHHKSTPSPLFSKRWWHHEGHLANRPHNFAIWVSDNSVAWTVDKILPGGFSVRFADSEAATTLMWSFLAHGSLGAVVQTSSHARSMAQAARTLSESAAGAVAAAPPTQDSPSLGHPMTAVEGATKGEGEAVWPSIAPTAHRPATNPYSPLPQNIPPPHFSSPELLTQMEEDVRQQAAGARTHRTLSPNPITLASIRGV